MVARIRLVEVIFLIFGLDSNPSMMLLIDSLLDLLFCFCFGLVFVGCVVVTTASGCHVMF